MGESRPSISFEVICSGQENYSKRSALVSFSESPCREKLFGGQPAQKFHVAISNAISRLPSSLGHIFDWLYLRQCIYYLCVCRGLNERVRVVVEPVVPPFPQRLVGFLFSQICRAILKSTQTYQVSHASSVSLTLCRSYSRFHTQTHKSHASSNACQCLHQTTSFIICFVQGMLCMRGWCLGMRLILVMLS